MAFLSELHVYPVKGCGGISLETAALERRGVPGDRAWMVVDPDGQFISQRTEPRLARIRVQFDGGRLRLEAPGLSPLELSQRAGGTPVQVTVWDDRCAAVDVGDGPASWLERHLGRPARLVRMEAAFDRRANPALAPEGTLSFADAFPVLVLSRASLEDLVTRLPAPLRMNRFRPNLVLAESEPFEEDRWQRIRIGEAMLRLVKQCVRCVATTVEQETAETGQEPLRTLATFRRWAGGGVIFGQNAVVEVEGRVRVGDPVEVLAIAEPPVLVKVNPSGDGRRLPADAAVPED